MHLTLEDTIKAVDGIGIRIAKHILVAAIKNALVQFLAPTRLIIRSCAKTSSANRCIPHYRHMEPLRQCVVEFEVECSTTNFRWRDL